MNLTKETPSLVREWMEKRVFMEEGGVISLEVLHADFQAFYAAHSWARYVDRRSLGRQLSGLYPNKTMTRRRISHYLGIALRGA